MGEKNLFSYFSGLRVSFVNFLVVAHCDHKPSQKEYQAQVENVHPHKHGEVDRSVLMVHIHCYLHLRIEIGLQTTSCISYSFAYMLKLGCLRLR